MEEIPEQDRFKAQTPQVASKKKQQAAVAAAPSTTSTNQTTEEQAQPPKGTRSLLICKTYNQWLVDAAKEPQPKFLFGPLICEEELTMLYSKSNLGKSALAVQIGDGVADGKRNILPGVTWHDHEGEHEFGSQCPPMPTLIMDFEMSSRQIFARRRNRENNTYTPTSPNLYRVVMDLTATVGGKTDTGAIMEALKSTIEAHNIKFLIIDNITWLNTALEKSSDAGAFMTALKCYANSLKITLLVLAHCPKISGNDPITLESLAGSHVVGALADAAFAIGKCATDQDKAYIKQIKGRMERLEFAAPVISVRRGFYNGSLGFVAEGTEREREFLMTEEAKKLALVRELKLAGFSQKDIAKKVGFSQPTVSRVLRENPQKD